MPWLIELLRPRRLGRASRKSFWAGPCWLLGVPLCASRAASAWARNAKVRLLVWFCGEPDPEPPKRGAMSIGAAACAMSSKSCESSRKWRGGKLQFPAVSKRRSASDSCCDGVAPSACLVRCQAGKGSQKRPRETGLTRGGEAACALGVEKGVVSAGEAWPRSLLMGEW